MKIEKQIVFPRNKRGTTIPSRGPFSNTILTSQTGTRTSGINQRFFPRGKRGGKIISIYWFLVLTIIAGGIILMANAFYGTPYDVRGAEARILTEKVSDCIYFGGRMNSDLISPSGEFKQEFSDNFLSHCSLNFDSKGEFEGVEYYVGLKFFNNEENKIPKFLLETGNKNWIPDCSVLNAKRLVECYKNEFWVNSPDGKTYLVKTLGIIKKTEKNVN